MHGQAGTAQAEGEAQHLHEQAGAQTGAVGQVRQASINAHGHVGDRNEAEALEAALVGVVEYVSDRLHKGFVHAYVHADPQVVSDLLGHPLDDDLARQFNQHGLQRRYPHPQHEQPLLPRPVPPVHLRPENQAPNHLDRQFRFEWNNENHQPEYVLDDQNLQNRQSQQLVREPGQSGFEQVRPVAHDQHHKYVDEHDLVQDAVETSVQHPDCEGVLLAPLLALAEPPLEQDCGLDNRERHAHDQQHAGPREVVFELVLEEAEQLSLLQFDQADGDLLGLLEDYQLK
eukprot:CAMPEP_0116955512 /NCGR_PEP_ID=MMETSP0467-20121206/42672_1 /TAXON_ID=283647 /ORGANISM="Mesodinium pulex, Strain SPMC105" /LENGTH=285 /DNA_ID=CAMNT_0004641589 /DNA_START=772 /DNA_END=1629 /DNA_ORIENTATION=+